MTFVWCMAFTVLLFVQLEMSSLFHFRVKCHNCVAVFLCNSTWRTVSMTCLLCAQICCILDVCFCVKLLKTGLKAVYFWQSSELEPFFASFWFLTVQCHKVFIFCLFWYYDWQDLGILLLFVLFFATHTKDLLISPILRVELIVVCLAQWCYAIWVNWVYLYQL